MLKDRVKRALRITHTMLDEEINARILAAKKEMIRVGVAKEAAENEDDPLIGEAILTYCMMELGDQSLFERYSEGWDYRIDNLRKSRNYQRNGVADAQ